MIRISLGPDQLDKIWEYAPCSEGAAPAFKHSTQQFEKLLEACDEAYKKGYLISIPVFEDKPFRNRFPNAKEITKETWRHAYLALKVNINWNKSTI